MPCVYSLRMVKNYRICPIRIKIIHGRHRVVQLAIARGKIHIKAQPMCKFAQLYACHELFLKCVFGHEWSYFDIKLYDLVILFIIQTQNFLYIFCCIFHSPRKNLRAMILRGSTGRSCHLENVESYMLYLQQYTKIIKMLTLKTYFR